MLVERARQRKLDEDAVDPLISVQLFDLGEERAFIGFGKKAVLPRVHPGGERRLAFRANINLACRILAEKHHREPGLATRAPFELGGVLPDLVSKPRGEGPAVDHPRGHRLRPAPTGL